MPSFANLFPPNTIIKDFAYALTHPLRLGDFEMYDAASDDDYAYQDESLDESLDEINRRAIALFDFSPENDNEVRLVEGQVIWISYRHGQGWLVAEDPTTGENGLVPEEYVEIFDEEEAEESEHDENNAVQNPDKAKGENQTTDPDDPKPFLPGILRQQESDSDWVDTEYEEEEELAAGVKKASLE